MKQISIPLGKVVRYYKAKVTREIRKKFNKNFSWLSNYYEHIIRNEKDLYRIQDYIQKKST